MSVVPSNKKHKVVVFDVDETLGNFTQFSIFTQVLDDYFNVPDITYKYYNDLVDLYPEIIRPSMVRILDYIRKKKTAGLCRKVIIYTNNAGPDKWVTHIRRYFEHKLKEITLASQTTKGLLIVPPLFDRLIPGYKPDQAVLTDGGYPQRTTNDKTMNDLIYCSRLPPDIEVCFLDDLYHSKMTDERVYYIKLQPYYYYISMETFVLRFLNSTLYRNVFDKMVTSLSIMPNTSAAVKRKIVSIELYDKFVKYSNEYNYNAKKVQKKMNPREIDEIISKYILYHLQQFFRDGPPQQPTSSKIRRLSYSKTVKKKGHSNHQSSSSSNVFIVDKINAVKNMHNKTVRNR